VCACVCVCVYDLRVYDVCEMCVCECVYVNVCTELYVCVMRVWCV